MGRVKDTQQAPKGRKTAADRRTSRDYKYAGNLLKLRGTKGGNTIGRLLDKQLEGGPEKDTRKVGGTTPASRIGLKTENRNKKTRRGGRGAKSYSKAGGPARTNKFRPRPKKKK